MKEINLSEMDMISGAASGCSWKGFGQAATSGAIGGGIGGALGGSVVMPGLGSIPGWLGGAILGGAGGGAAYGATCWW